MNDHYSAQRAEAASADVRRAEEKVAYAHVGRDAALAQRPPGTVMEIRAIVGNIVDRAEVLRERIADTATRTFGEVPTALDKAAIEGPPYGGDMAELFYMVQRLGIIVDDANRQFNRLENVA